MTSSLGIFLHFMPGEDDDLLKWPFAGQFHLRLKNQSQKQQPGATADLIEKMPSQPKMTAFDCPSPEALRNPIGFGLQELISIDKLMNEGFWNSSRDEVIGILHHMFSRILNLPFYKNFHEIFFSLFFYKLDGFD
jgi:hypothetical protein